MRSPCNDVGALLDVDNVGDAVGALPDVDNVGDAEGALLDCKSGGGAVGVTLAVDCVGALVVPLIGPAVGKAA